MTHEPVTSSNVESIGYDPEARTLEAKYKGGGVYEYSGVEPHEHAALMNAASIGAHLYKHFIHRSAGKTWRKVG